MFIFGTCFIGMKYTLWSAFRPETYRLPVWRVLHLMGNMLFYENFRHIFLNNCKHYNVYIWYNYIVNNFRTQDSLTSSFINTWIVDVNYVIDFWNQDLPTSCLNKVLLLMENVLFYANFHHIIFPTGKG